MVRGDAERGIVLGGSGQGEQIAANKVHGVRAALCNDLYTARLSREHNDANVLSMGGRIVAFGLATEILELWLSTPFEGGRHERRVAQIADIEREEYDRPMPWPQNPDDEVFALIDRELERQNTTLQLIASENFTSPAVLRATGSVLTNKYSEGYPAQALLRRQRGHRRGREHRPRPRQGAVRRRRTPTCSPTPAPTPTWPSTWRC